MDVPQLVRVSYIVVLEILFNLPASPEFLCSKPETIDGYRANAQGDETELLEAIAHSDDGTHQRASDPARRGLVSMNFIHMRNRNLSCLRIIV